MKLAFYIHNGEILDKAIKIYSSKWKEIFNGKWKEIASHVEFIFSNGVWFSSSPRDGGARFKYIDTKYGRWVYFDLDLTKTEEEMIYNWCQKIQGKKYDWKGILGFVIPFIKDDKDKRFCSECIVDGMQVINKLLVNFKSNKTTPRDIMDYLYENGYKGYM